MGRNPALVYLFIMKRFVGMGYPPIENELHIIYLIPDRWYFFTTINNNVRPINLF